MCSAHIFPLSFFKIAIQLLRFEVESMLRAESVAMRTASGPAISHVFTMFASMEYM